MEYIVLSEEKLTPLAIIYFGLGHSTCERDFGVCAPLYKTQKSLLRKRIARNNFYIWVTEAQKLSLKELVHAVQYVGLITKRTQSASSQ